MHLSPGKLRKTGYLDIIRDLIVKLTDEDLSI